MMTMIVEWGLWTKEIERLYVGYEGDEQDIGGSC